MNTKEVITLVLSSSILTALITGALNWFMKRNDYKKEVYKKIIDKRLIAYQEVEQLIKSMYFVLYDKRTGLKYNKFLMDVEDFNEFFVHFGRSMNNSIWYSTGLRKLLQSLNQFVLNNSNIFPVNRLEEPKTETDIIKEISPFYDEINDLKTELENQLIIDYHSFHKISEQGLKRAITK